MERREFLKTAGLFSALFLSGYYFNLNTGEIYAREITEDSTDKPCNEQEPSILEKYLRDIEPNRKQLESKVVNNDFFQGFKSLTPSQQLEDFTMYFPIYYGGQTKYEIPWFLLWIIHTHETTVSRASDPERNGYRGAMQLHPMHEVELKDAGAGWEFLDDLDQRYLKKHGFRTNDWEEIFKAALYIRNRANQKSFYSDEEKILNVITYNYSATIYGLIRVKQYHYIKSLLEE